MRPAWAFFLNSLEVSESMEQRMLVRETEQGAYLGPGPELEAAAVTVAATPHFDVFDWGCRRLILGKCSRLPRPAAGLSCQCCNKPGGSIFNGHYWSHIAFPFTYYYSEGFRTTGQKRQAAMNQGNGEGPMSSRSLWIQKGKVALHHQNFSIILKSRGYNPHP